MVASPVDVFASTILPVLTVAAVGYVLGAGTDVDVEPLNTVTLYVLMPALVFHSLATTTVDGGAIGVVVAAVVAFTLVMMALAAGVGRLLGESGPTLRALVLAGAVPNVGNFGIPVSTAAFGQVGRDTAVLFVVGQSLVVFTAGVVVASGGRAGGWRASARRVVTFPLVYVVVLALSASWLGVVPPESGVAMETVTSVGNASIPLFLLILGIQLARTDAGAALRRTLPAVGLKLAVAPALAVGIALLIGFETPAVARTFVLEAGAPVAVTPLALAIEFADPETAPDGGDPDDHATADHEATVSAQAYLGTAIFVTTVASVVTVTALIAVLRAGLVV